MILSIEQHIRKIEEVKALESDFLDALEVQSGILALHGVGPQALERNRDEVLGTIETKRVKREYVDRILDLSGAIIGTNSLLEARNIFDAARQKPTSFSTAMEQLDAITILIRRAPNPFINSFLGRE